MESNQNSFMQKINSKTLAIIGMLILLVILAFIVLNSLKLFFVQSTTSENNNYLASRLETEDSKINEAFSKRFDFLKDYYNINKIVLIGNENYAAVLVSLDSTTYKALMVKNDDTWAAVGIPAVVLFYEDFENIPQDIIKTINNLEVE